MAALIMHGVTPGVPFMMSGVMPYVVFSGMLLGQAAYFIVGMFAVKWFAKMAYVPLVVIAPPGGGVMLHGRAGRTRLFFDVALMLVIGLIGYLFTRAGYSMACLILGLIIGPIVEGYLHRSLMIQHGSWAIFMTRPISAVLIILSLISLFAPYVYDLLRKKTHERTGLRDALGILIPDRKMAAWELGLLGALVVGFAMITSQLYRYGEQLRFWPQILLWLARSLWHCGWLDSSRALAVEANAGAVKPRSYVVAGVRRSAALCGVDAIGGLPIASGAFTALVLTQAGSLR